MMYLGGIHYWWPKVFGKLYHQGMARASAVVIFIGFNLTFFPQFIVGYLGMPRRYQRTRRSSSCGTSCRVRERSSWPSATRCPRST